jgi:hypothetical protein
MQTLSKLRCARDSAVLIRYFLIRGSLAACTLTNSILPIPDSVGKMLCYVLSLRRASSAFRESKVTSDELKDERIGHPITRKQ